MCDIMGSGNKNWQIKNGLSRLRWMEFNELIELLMSNQSHILKRASVQLSIPLNFIPTLSIYQQGHFQEFFFFLLVLFLSVLGKQRLASLFSACLCRADVSFEKWSWYCRVRVRRALHWTPNGTVDKWSWLGFTNVAIGFYYLWTEGYTSRFYMMLLKR